MIKIRKGNLILICLDKTNINRLLDNKPILFKGEDVYLEGVQIGIIAAETTADLVEDLRSMGMTP